MSFFDSTAMARPNREAIDTFISITGSSEEVAIQRLQEHNGDLNQAVDVHFNEGDRNLVQAAPVSASASENDLMDIDDPPEIVPRHLPSLFSETTRLNPFSLLDPDFRNHLLNRSRLFDSTADVRSRAPVVSHPREVREIPIEFKDGNSSSARTGHGPAIVDVTDSEQAHGPETYGTVTIEDDNTDTETNVHSHYVGQSDPTYCSHPRPSAPPVFDTAPYDGNDIEEEMLRAAIEASKREAELQTHHELSTDLPRETGPDLHDDELSRAVSMSLKTAEQERALREQGILAGDSGPSASRSFDVNGRGRVSDPNGRKEAGNSSTLGVVEELEEQPLVRHRSRRTSTALVNPDDVSDSYEDHHPLSDPDHGFDNQRQINGNAFLADEWGGISSAEHDEAVILEAAMFGAIRQEGGYNLSYAQPRPWGTPRPPSPALVAQRSIREQQDDEYFASLQADREKEWKSLEEERTAKQAALAEERRMEEEARRKLDEEQELERLLAAKESSLPAEPSADDNNVVNLVVRMPDGSRRGRRFLKSDKLQSLYDFIDVGRAVKPGTYKLVRPFPRRPFGDEESSSTLSELGLTSKQEALYLEPI